MSDSSNPFGSLSEHLKGFDWSTFAKQYEQPVMSSVVLTDPNLASEFRERLLKMVAAFEGRLDQEHEIGIRLVSFGESVTFHVESIGVYNPSLISFFGTKDDGTPIELIQHVSQISFLLTAVRPVQGQKPKRIGFISGEEE